jgi:hypothetical protein
MDITSLCREGKAGSNKHFIHPERDQGGCVIFI